MMAVWPAEPALPSPEAAQDRQGRLAAPSYE